MEREVRVEGHHFLNMGKIGDFQGLMVLPYHQHSGAEVPIHNGHLVRKEVEGPLSRLPDQIRYVHHQLCRNQKAENHRHSAKSLLFSRHEVRRLMKLRGKSMNQTSNIRTIVRITKTHRRLASHSSRSHLHNRLSDLHLI